MGPPFPIVREPAPDRREPLVISIPHFGTEAIPGIAASSYADPAFATFPHGYTDTFAADVYGALDEVGATVLATPYSRLFVDVNRRRDDFERIGGEIRSQRGVIKTHLVSDQPIFSGPLTRSRAEQRLRRYYDPYHAALDAIIGRLRENHDRVLLIDAHTGSPNRMGEHEVVIGTRGATTADPRLCARALGIFGEHGFEPHLDIPGYSGGYIVRRYGRPTATGVHALQIEVNVSLLMTTSRGELIARLERGERPARNDRNIARLRACLAALAGGLLRTLE
jgi:N-formylglutamate amidohydrolase